MRNRMTMTARETKIQITAMCERPSNINASCLQMQLKNMFPNSLLRNRQVDRRRMRRDQTEVELNDRIMSVPTNTQHHKRKHQHWPECSRLERVNDQRRHSKERQQDDQDLEAQFHGAFTLRVAIGV